MENQKVFSLAQKAVPFTVWIYRELLEQHVQQRTGDRILDIGCGVGDYRPTVKGQYVGVDINSGYIRRATELYPDAEFHVMDCSRLEFVDASFDQALVIAALHHVCDDDVVKAVREALRVLKADGQLHIIEAILPLAKFSPLKKVIFENDRGRYPRSFSRLVELLGSHFCLDKTVTKQGLIHDVCYIKILPSRAQRQSTDTVR